MITEAVLVDSNNKGSLRKDVWDYLLKKYQTKIDYRDFLLAIRRFQIDGKMFNQEGYFSMHPEVLVEVREKTPTPAFKKADGKSNENNIFLLKDVVAQSKKPEKTIKIKEAKKRKQMKESARQSKIQKYFMKKQMEPFGYDGFKNAVTQPDKGLGFATPAPQIINKQKVGKQDTQKKNELSNEKENQKIQKLKEDKNQKEQAVEIQKNNLFKKRQNMIKQKELANKISTQSRAIVKKSKLDKYFEKKRQQKEKIFEIRTIIVEKSKIKEDFQEAPKEKKETKKQDYQIMNKDILKPQVLQQQKINKKIKTAIKRATLLKNLRKRDQKSPKDQYINEIKEVKEQQKENPQVKQFSKLDKLQKTKRIKKPVNKFVKKQKLRELKKLANGDGKVLRNRLRKRTLDVSQKKPKLTQEKEIQQIIEFKKPKLTLEKEIQQIIEFKKPKIQKKIVLNKNIGQFGFIEVNEKPVKELQPRILKQNQQKETQQKIETPVKDRRVQKVVKQKIQRKARSQSREKQGSPIQTRSASREKEQKQKLRFSMSQPEMPVKKLLEKPQKKRILRVKLSKPIKKPIKKYKEKQTQVKKGKKQLGIRKKKIIKKIDLKRRLQLLKRQLNGHSIEILKKRKDRKAKLNARKALKQLFSKSSIQLYIDGRLIYV